MSTEATSQSEENHTDYDELSEALSFNRHYTFRITVFAIAATVIAIFLIQGCSRISTPPGSSNENLHQKLEKLQGDIDEIKQILSRKQK